MRSVSDSSSRELAVSLGFRAIINCELDPTNGAENLTKNKLDTLRVDVVLSGRKILETSRDSFKLSRSATLHIVWVVL
jgi:hypothetical protein